MLYLYVGGGVVQRNFLVMRIVGKMMLNGCLFAGSMMNGWTDEVSFIEVPGKNIAATSLAGLARVRSSALTEKLVRFIIVDIGFSIQSWSSPQVVKHNWGWPCSMALQINKNIYNWSGVLVVIFQVWKISVGLVTTTTGFRSNRRQVAPK